MSYEREMVPARTVRVLILQDQAADAELMLEELRGAGFEPVATRVQTEPEYLAQLESAPPEIVLSDYYMPGFTAPRALDLLHERGLDIPFLIVSGAIGEEIAVDAMHRGATDYVLKVRLSRLGQAVRAALEQQRLRAAKRAADEFTRMLFELGPDAILVVAADGAIVKANAQAGAMFGYNEAELLGQPLDLLLPERTRGVHDAHLRSYFAQPRVRRMGRCSNLLACRKDGTEFPVDVMLEPVQTSERQVAVATIRDVSARAAAERVRQGLVEEHRRAAESLRENELKFRTVFDTALDALVIADDSARFTDVNPAACEMFGLARDQLLGHGMAEFAAPGLQFDALWHAVLEGGGIQGLFRMARPDGAIRTLEYSATAHFLTGLHLLVLRDVTERIQSEERIRAQYAVTRVLADSTSAETAIPGILRELCDALDLGWGGLWLLNRADGRLQCVEFWRAPVAGLRELAECTRCAAIVLGHGALGEVAARGEPRGIADLSAAACERAEHATRCGFRSGLYVPIRLRHEVHGVFEFFCDDARAADPELLNLVAAIASQVGQFLERQQAARALARTEEKFRSIFENAVEGIYQTSVEGRFLTANPALARMYGYGSPDELLASISDVARQIYVEPEDRVRFQQVIAARGAVQGLEVRVRRKDGSVIWTSENARAVRDRHGATLFYEGTVEDITERKQAEQALRASEAALRHSEEQVRLLLDSTGEAIYGVDLDGRCTFCNPACARMLRFAGVNELSGREMHLLVHGKRSDGTPDPEAQSRILQAIRKQETTHADDELFCRADGTSFPVEYWAYPVRRDGAVVGAVVRFVDISERRALEAQFRQAQKMEAVGRLAGGVAHDFNNLLTVVACYSELALKELALPHPLAEYLVEIKDAGERAARLTRQLLAFSRRQVLQPVDMSLNSVIAEMEQMLRRLIGEDIDLRIVLAPELCPVKADPGQIEQVILNLVVNSRDAMPQGGKLTIETTNLWLDEHYAQSHPGTRPGLYASLAVSDNGCGMDEHTKAHLFEPFFTTKEHGKGTGLGLATVYGIMTQSDGHISVYSELHHGSTFRVYLPASPAPAVAPARDQFDDVPTGSESLLVVDDDDAIRNVLRYTLEKCGYLVFDARSGREAMVCAEMIGTPIDLLITDVVMPEINGRDLAMRLSRRQPGMKVLFMSGYTDEAVIRHGVLSAETPFLQKPFSPGGLARKVREVLDGNDGFPTAPSLRAAVIA